MKLDTVRSIADEQGPFATVYLEGRAPSEDAPDQLRLRWKALREHLSDNGATENALTALDDILTGSAPDKAREINADGRVLVANDSGTLLNEPWDANPGSGDSAHVSDVPELASYVRERSAAVRLLVVIADQTGAVVRRIVATEDKNLVDDNSDTEVTVEASSQDDVHKPRQGALSHNQIQRSADEAVKQNARGIADRLSDIADEWTPDIILLAGETQGRTAVRTELEDHLPALAELLQETEDGGTADTGGDGAEEALSDVISTVASDVSAGSRLAETERFEKARVRNLAVAGADVVNKAADLGAVETLLLQYEDTAADESKLLVTCAYTDADATLIDVATPGNIAAILRYELPDELTSTN